jgi:HEPN domain-containing protein/predicted nucleotidyltransferase
MVALSQDKLDAITNRLVEELRPERIYLFGSRAYGTPHQHSDLDLVIVVPDGEGGAKNFYVEAREAVGDIGCDVDILVYTADEFDRRSGWDANFEHTVRNKGRLLYGEDGMAFAREWLQKSANDLAGAQRLIGGDPPLVDLAAFHCQQAVEKTLKAFLTHHNEPFEKVHDLGLLCRDCEKIDPDFSTICERVGTLNRYAVLLRYPGPKEPSADEIREAVALVQEVWDFVLARLPEELRNIGSQPSDA